jgi:hypothetical protein
MTTCKSSRDVDAPESRPVWLVAVSLRTGGVLRREHAAARHYRGTLVEVGSQGDYDLWMSDDSAIRVRSTVSEEHALAAAAAVRAEILKWTAEPALTLDHSTDAREVRAEESLNLFLAGKLSPDEARAIAAMPSPKDHGR